MITKERAKEILSEYFDEPISYIDQDGNLRENDGLTLQHSSALFLVLIFEGNQKAFNAAAELINLGNPLVDSVRALKRAEQDEEFLLKCRQWIEAGLTKKMDTAFGSLPN